MEKHGDAIPPVDPDQDSPDHAAVPAPPVHLMSLEKAKKLISKTSAEHKKLFRRLAQ